MTHFVFDVPDGAIGEARRDDSVTVSVIRFGFVARPAVVDSSGAPSSDLARVLARGIWGMDPRICMQNIERNWAYCPLCDAPVLAHQDGKTYPFSRDEEPRVRQEVRGGGATIIPSGELWIAVEGHHPLVSPILVVHFVDFHGYSPPAEVLALLITE